METLIESLVTKDSPGMAVEVIEGGPVCTEEQLAKLESKLKSD
jgi:hypothetical protein